MDVRFPMDASLDILRRLLDEESLVLAQLTYVVKQIHDPILEGCNPLNNKQREGHKNSGPKSPVILTFAQYWELFANIATLHGAQSVLVSKLESIICQSNHFLEKEEEIVKNTQIDSSLLVSGGEEDNEVSDIHNISELFCSASMRHYIAEHMMYSLNYGRNIAPRVMEIWRLWRSRCDKHANVHLSIEERQQLNYYLKFLNFLWSSFDGEKGVPADPRVVTTRLPETSASTPTSNENNNNNNNNSSINISCTSSIKSSSLSIVIQDMPPIPSHWRGFETLLVLLSTPLASLRRYMHVARCLIESQSLTKSIRHHLQTEFVDVVALRISEEGSIILDELVKQEISHIMDLIDEVAVTGTPGTSEKKFPRIRPDLHGGRTLIHYGRLVKRFRRGRHERLVFLFSDWFCYVEELANGRMRLRASISLESLKVVELENTAEAVNGFDIVTKETRLTFFAPTWQQKQQWVDALRNTAKAHEKRTQQQATTHHNINTSSVSSFLPHPRGYQSQNSQQQQQIQQSGNVRCLMRATAPSLANNSRLHRQQLADQVYQQRLERRTKSLSSTKQSSQIIIPTTGATPAVSVPVESVEVKEAEPIPTSTTSSKIITTKTNSSIIISPQTLPTQETFPASARTNSSPRHRRPMHGLFDVTHWAQQSAETMHKRVRSTDFFHNTSLVLPSPMETEAIVSPIFSNLCLTGQEDIIRGVSPPMSPHRPSRVTMTRLVSERFEEARIPMLSSENNSPRVEGNLILGEGEEDKEEEKEKEEENEKNQKVDDENDEEEVLPTIISPPTMSVASGTLVYENNSSTSANMLIKSDDLINADRIKTNTGEIDNQHPLGISVISSEVEVTGVIENNSSTSTSSISEGAVQHVNRYPEPSELSTS